MRKRLFMIMSVIFLSMNSNRSYPLYDSESAQQAKQRFKCMTAKQMNNLCIHELTVNQMRGFKELATELFHSEVATCGCERQANRVKYEIMYQKLGELQSLKPL